MVAALGRRTASNRDELRLGSTVERATDAGVRANRARECGLWPRLHKLLPNANDLPFAEPDFLRDFPIVATAIGMRFIG